MASLEAHIRQANHNEACARHVMGSDDQYRDWAITAAFYAAVHLAEATFYEIPRVKHSDQAWDRGKRDPHGYRIDKIRDIAKGAYKSYKKLYNASRHVRYLTYMAEGGQFGPAYFTESDAQTLIDIHLETVRSELEKATGTSLPKT